ncbi:MAG: hypothetical protein JNL21_18460 [Myxococcales bacterium]|nr:hypothetical protein [Myxococcales bacterium]
MVDQLVAAGRRTPEAALVKLGQLRTQFAAVADTFDDQVAAELGAQRASDA